MVFTNRNMLGEGNKYYPQLFMVVFNVKYLNTHNGTERERSAVSHILFTRANSDPHHEPRIQPKLSYPSSFRSILILFSHGLVVFLNLDFSAAIRLESLNSSIRVTCLANLTID
jgi:hypothetical protein